MSQLISPYDREDGFSETKLALAVLLSFAFHLLLAWAFMVFLPTLMTSRNEELNFIPIDLYGALAPEAAAAPADLPVDPEQKGPDVVEAPKSGPAITQPQFQPVTPEAVTAPADVIPLGPKAKAPEKPPEIKKVSPPPKITPPKVEQPKPKPNTDAEINKRMEALKRKREADQLDEAIEARMYNLNLERGRGEGDSSERSGVSGGQQVDPEVARYFSHIRDIIAENWVPPVEASSNRNHAIYRITIDPSGRITNLQLVRSSGSQSYDQSVQRAINKSNPLPQLPPIFGGQSISPGLAFNPDELQRINRQRNRAYPAASASLPAG